MEGLCEGREGVGNEGGWWWCYIWRGYRGKGMGRREGEIPRQWRWCYMKGNKGLGIGLGETEGVVVVLHEGLQGKGMCVGRGIDGIVRQCSAT